MCHKSWAHFQNANTDSGDLQKKAPESAYIDITIYHSSPYFMDLVNYSPRNSHAVKVGNTTIGGGNPLRLQSMTTTLTTDTEASVEQCIRIIEAGADLVR